MERNYGTLAALAIAALAVPIAAISAPSATTTAQGVYSEAQAEAGASLYATRCAICHGKALEGTYDIPPLAGRFMGNWGHAPLGRLFDYVSKAMPQMAPGSLTPDQNAAIVAYLLKQNGMPAGAKPMANEAEALDKITIEPAKK